MVFFPRAPHGWGGGGRDRLKVVGCCSGPGWVRNKRVGLRGVGGVDGKSLGTLLGFEATRRWGCCRPAWWWGVVFEFWIVVASILMNQRAVVVRWFECF